MTEPDRPSLAFLLVLRLGDALDPAGDYWRWWATRIEAASVAQAQEPYKSYRSNGDEYFSAHVADALFPPSTGDRGGRWISRPSDTSLWVLGPGARQHELNIELLEIVRFGLRTRPTYGLIHLSYLGTPTPDDALNCSRALHHRFGPPPGEPSTSLAVVRDGTAVQMNAAAPLRALAEHLFRSAHPAIGHTAWIMAVSDEPEDLEPADLAAWRRGLSRGHSLDRSRRMIAAAPDRHERQTQQLGPMTVVVSGRGASFFHRGNRNAVYNVRSLWSEALLIAIAQHDYLERFAMDLGKLGHDPLSKAVDDLYIDWLTYSNVLGWSYLSTVTDVSQRLLVLARHALGTEALREELEQAFQTYIAQRERQSDAAQEASLAALQIYGAVFAAVGTVATAAAAVGDGLISHSWVTRVGVGVALVVLGIAVFAFTKARVRNAKT